MKSYDVLILSGAATVVGGIATYSWRAAVIVAGVALIAAGFKLLPKAG